MANLSTKFVEWLAINTTSYRNGKEMMYFKGETHYTLDELYNIFFEEQRQDPDSIIWNKDYD